MPEPATWRDARHTTRRAITHSPGVHLFRQAILTSLIAVTFVSSFAAMVELDRLIAQAISIEGKSWTLSSIIGIQPWLGLSAWPGWGNTSFTDLETIILFHVFADIVFIAAYAVTGLYLIGKYVPRTPQPKTTSRAKKPTP
ncbi:hypothetical protein LG299_14210 [Microbacterium lacus]|uniref:hypothetical protein n=1 Tax=Microbacterium lacus TaxID=415217 RepID=UPI00384AFA89